MLGVNRCGSVIGKLQADRQSQKYTPGSETASRLIHPSIGLLPQAMFTRTSFCGASFLRSGRAVNILLAANRTSVVT